MTERKSKRYMENEFKKKNRLIGSREIEKSCSCISFLKVFFLFSGHNCFRYCDSVHT